MNNNTPSRPLIALITFAMVLVAGTTQAATLAFRDGADILFNGAGLGQIYNGTNDVEIRENPGHANQNFDHGTGSSDPEFTVDQVDGGGEAQVLMRFDDIFGNGAGQVALGSIINSATLFIDIDNTGADLELYDLTTDFGSETTATWNNFSTGNGVQVGVNASAGPVSVNGGGNKLVIDVTSTVSAWASGTLANFGWGFVSTGSNGVDFDASENSDFADRPLLTIDFTTTPPAAVPLPPSLVLALSAVGFVFGVGRRSRAA